MIQTLQTIADNIQAASQPGWVECLSIVISSISVVVSGVAIWFAIRVPKQIAEEQNDIALFEKRYEILCLYSSCRSFANVMKTLKKYKIEIDKVKIREIFAIVFFDGKTDKDYNDFELIRMKNDEILDKMERSKFLFEYDISSYIRISYIVLYTIVISALDKDAQFDDNYISNLIGLMDDKKYDAIVEKMEAKLTL